MKVKVGNKIFSSENQPIMVILTDKDKGNITNMDPDCTKYATFQDDCGTQKQMLEWMDANQEKRTRAWPTKGFLRRTGRIIGLLR